MIIYIRKDLNMRKGKAIAQASHAAQLAIFQLFEMSSENAYMDATTMRGMIIPWLNSDDSIKIEWVDNQEALENRIKAAVNVNCLVSSVVDQGRTEFKGVKTLTSAAVLPPMFKQRVGSRPLTPVNLKNLLEQDKKGGLNRLLKPMGTKQVFVLNKAYKISRDNLIAKSVATSINAIFLLCNSNDQRVWINFRTASTLTSWLSGHYAKIVTGTSDFNTFKRQLPQLCGLHFESAEGAKRYFSNDEIIVFSPLLNKEINPITGDLKLE